MIKMELKEGMYIRTKEGIIDKVIIDYEGHCNSPRCNCKHVSCRYNYYDEDEIVKTSHNIIDLIEVGDYVNGVLIESIYSREEDKIHFHTFGEEIMIEITNENVNNIVTKEQFSSMSYKVGE